MKGNEGLRRFPHVTGVASGRAEDELRGEERGREATGDGDLGESSETFPIQYTEFSRGKGEAGPRVVRGLRGD